MSIKLNQIVINPAYENLFEFSSEREKLEHNAQMISFRILSEVEKVCDEKKIKKKDLAELTGTSKSYITQLFRGTKSVNTGIMAKFEEVLDFSFNIGIKLDAESYVDYYSKHLPSDMRRSTRRFPASGGTWFFCPNKEANGIVENMRTENKVKQIA
jgi:transcriptional regulator with XRE-family HTH domain